MTARIQRVFDFTAGVYLNNELIMTNYDLEIDFLVSTEENYEQNTALDRIKYIIHEKFDSAIFINETEYETIEKLVAADLKVITLPEDPYDQIVGIAAMLKLNSILDGKFVATDIKTTSGISDGVSYYYSMEEDIGPFVVKGWWSDSSPNTNGRIQKPKNIKVLKLTKTAHSWEDLSLGWVEQAPKTMLSDVVFVDFEHKADK
jgi:hypothetical protein